MVRANMRLGGMLSEGIALGHRTGFDSGSTLDYVYRNQPRGAGPLGRLIDRNYLNSIGWRGIRQRKLHIEELLGLAMRALADERRQRYESSTSPPDTAGTCSTRWREAG